MTTMRKDASVIRFFQNHRWLLRDARVARLANARLALAHRRLAATRAAATRTRAILARKAALRRQRLLAVSLDRPERAICHVFGSHCRQALQVARCESGYRTTAQNGQYRGIFQMGSHERRTFGHGASALAQARAAFRYFVLSGRDWGPWSCKPWS